MRRRDWRRQEAVLPIGAPLLPGRPPARRHATAPSRSLRLSPWDRLPAASIGRASPGSACRVHVKARAEQLSWSWCAWPPTRALEKIAPARLLVGLAHALTRLAHTCDLRQRRRGTHSTCRGPGRPSRGRHRLSLCRPVRARPAARFTVACPLRVRRRPGEVLHVAAPAGSAIHAGCPAAARPSQPVRRRHPVPASPAAGEQRARNKNFY